jgi:uncharacterized protein
MNSPSNPSPHERFVANLTVDNNLPWTVFETGIPVRDGLELAADVYLPKCETGPFPTIVQATPYDKSGPGMRTDIALYPANGYALVVVDLRGRGKSEGIWRPIVDEGPDCHDVIEWAATQDWSTGKVGMTGLSYMGWVQWAAASLRPPHLAAMVSTSAAGRWQQEIPYTNGCFQLFFGWWCFAVRRRIREAHGMQINNWEEILRWLPLEKIGEFINPSGPIWETMVGHDTLDDFWKTYRYDDRYNEFNIPVLHVTGWYDLEDLLGAFHHYEHMIAASPQSDSQRLIVGPWSHVNSRLPHHSYSGTFLSADAATDMDAEHLRWFDYWLKGIDNGVLETPAARLYQTGSNSWRESDHWPLATYTATMYLSDDGAAGTLSSRPPVQATQHSYRYDPLDPAPTQIDIHRYSVDQIPIDQTAVEKRADVLTYTSTPLKEEVVMSGWARVQIHAASDCTDTEWHVKITDVNPDGLSVKVCQGCLRASYRDSLERPAPLEPGTPYLFDIEMSPAHHAFLPGHQIRLSITSSDFPWFARSLNQFGPLRFQSEPIVATNTVHHGGSHLSAVVLPIEQGELPVYALASNTG